MVFAICFTGTCKKFEESVLSISVINQGAKGIAFMVGENYPDTSIPDKFDDIRGVSPCCAKKQNIKKD
jgi:hypothetical protein